MDESKIRKPVYKKWWFWVIIMVLVIGVAGVQEDGNITQETSSNTQSSTEINKTQEKFTLVESEGSYDGFAYYVTGTIKNNTNKEYAYVQVTFNLYDSDGAQIGTAMANINNLEPNATWKFKALGVTEEVASYKLAEITGW